MTDEQIAELDRQYDHMRQVDAERCAEMSERNLILDCQATLAAILELHGIPVVVE